MTLTRPVLRLLPDTLVDVSRTLREGMAVWPGDTPFSREVHASPATGHAVTVSALRLSSHAGTHVDAPLHTDPAAGGVETLELWRFVGPAIVLDARGRRELGQELLPAHVMKSGKRILFRTDYGFEHTAVRAAGDGAIGGPEGDEYGPDIPYIVPALARTLAAGRVPLVGLDGPSVDPFDSVSLESHRILVGGDVAVLENLDLSDVEPGDWVLIAVPLKLSGCDGAPVRAVLARSARNDSTCPGEIPLRGDVAT